MIRNWPCTLPDGTISEELLVSYGESSETNFLIIPPLFDEHNKMRRQIALLMRRMAEVGIGADVPDLPGWNESLQPLSAQTLTFWRGAIKEAAQAFGTASFLAIRSGALLAPSDLSGWLYEPQTGPKLLRGMVRARIIASKEAGRPETSDQIHKLGREQGITLAGWDLSAEMFRELETAEIGTSPRYQTIEQAQIGGQALWLRAEAGEDDAQAETLAAIISSTESAAT